MASQYEILRLTVLTELYKTAGRISSLQRLSPNEDNANHADYWGTKFINANFRIWGQFTNATCDGRVCSIISDLAELNTLIDWIQHKIHRDMCPSTEEVTKRLAHLM